MKAIIEGPRYRLANFENKDAEDQTLQFIQKEPVSTRPGEMVTISDGTTNEEVLDVLIDRLQFLDSKFSCQENQHALYHLESALLWLEKRTRDRKKRGVEGKNKA